MSPQFIENEILFYINFRITFLLLNPFLIFVEKLHYKSKTSSKNTMPYHDEQHKMALDSNIYRNKNWDNAKKKMITDIYTLK